MSNLPSPQSGKRFAIALMLSGVLGAVRSSTDTTSVSSPLIQGQTNSIQHSVSRSIPTSLVPTQENLAGPDLVVPPPSETAVIEHGSTMAPSAAEMFFPEQMVAPDIHITVELPEKAKLTVNGDPTASEGPTRYFVVRHLEIGRTYKFVMAAETENAAGVPLEEIQTLTLSPGARECLCFNPYKKKKSDEEKKKEEEAAAKEEGAEALSEGDDEESGEGDSAEEVSAEEE